MIAKTVRELAGIWPLVEQAIGRELRETERVVDVFKLDAALERAKTDLTKAIKAEQRRAIRSALASGRKVKLKFTPAMLEPLKRLRRLGEKEGAAELRRAGYKIPARELAIAPIPKGGDTDAYVRSSVFDLSVWIEKERVRLGLSAKARGALIDALYAVPGARDIASRVVSTALNQGFAATFERSQDLVSGWEYSAILDGGTCDSCAALDGETFETWEDAMEVMPGGGPNPDCDGGGRCRCTIVPQGPA